MPLILPDQSPPKKRYGLFTLAILLLLAGGAALFVGSNDFAIRSLGLVACAVSVYLVKISNVHKEPASAAKGGHDRESKETKRPGRLTWAFAAVSLLMMGASFLYLYNDALDGYQKTLPVYVFAGVAAAFALFWSYLVSRML